MTLYLRGDGIELADSATGRSRIVRFGTPATQALALLEPVTGDLEMGVVVTDCTLPSSFDNSYPRGLLLTFEDGRFVAWHQGRAEGGYAMRNGLAIDMARAQLVSLGRVTITPVRNVDPPGSEDFSFGPISGELLNGRVDRFNAGRTSCSS